MGTKCSHKVLITETEEGLTTELASVMTGRRLERLRKELWAQDNRWPLSAGEGEGIDSLLGPPEGSDLASALTLAWWS